jgi:DNA primase
MDAGRRSARAKKKSLYEIVETACVFFEEQLRRAAARAAREYLVSRGIDDATIKQFRLGYSPDSNTALIGHLKAKNISLDDMVAAGLARRPTTAAARAISSTTALMFPISDGRGRVIAFGARALEADAKPKYINTGETTLFSKGQLLYNFATARAAALKAGTIIVAEGYMDVIALVRAGFEAAVAPLGTALTEDQLALLWRTAPEPILSFDGDDAGLRAAQRGARLALAQLKPGHSLRFAFLPPGEDPDSFIRRRGRRDEEGAGRGRAARPKCCGGWRPRARIFHARTPGRARKIAGEIVSQIRDGKIADYYRREFDRRCSTPSSAARRARTGNPRRDQAPGAAALQRGGRPGPIENVSPAVRNSLLARSGRTGVLQLKEWSSLALLLQHPKSPSSTAKSWPRCRFRTVRLTGCGMNS